MTTIPSSSHEVVPVRVRCPDQTPGFFFSRHAMRGFAPASVGAFSFNDDCGVESRHAWPWGHGAPWIKNPKGWTLHTRPNSTVPAVVAHGQSSPFNDNRGVDSDTGSRSRRGIRGINRLNHPHGTTFAKAVLDGRSGFACSSHRDRRPLQSRCNSGRLSPFMAKARRSLGSYAGLGPLNDARKPALGVSSWSAERVGATEATTL